MINLETPSNSIFIATSLDGYIADANGNIDWLHSIPNPDQNDMGYNDFMQNIDALVMGRKTFETILSFDIDWPYTQPVFVLSHSLKQLPNHLENKAFLASGPPTDVLQHIHEQGYYRLYIDGGSTIQQFLQEGLIDSMVITSFPVLLGGGSSLFGALPNRAEFELVESNTFLNQVVQNCYRLKR